MSRGVIYIATGKKYVNEAIQSAKSLKSVIPNLPITLFSDQKNIQDSCLDQSIVMQGDYEDSRIYKISYMYKSPYEETLFLDSDTYICADFSDIFQLLDRFDIAMAHDPTRFFYPLEGIPDSFPEMNSGVLLFKKNPHVEQFFESWLTLYKEFLEASQKPINRDQFSLRVALYNSDRQLRIATLLPEYNCRFENITFVHGEVKILHGRAQDLPQVAKKVNEKLVHRAIRRPLGTEETIMIYKFGAKTKLRGFLKNPVKVFKKLF